LKSPVRILNYDEEQPKDEFIVDDEIVAFQSSDNVIFVNSKLPINIALKDASALRFADKWDISIDESTLLGQRYLSAKSQLDNCFWIGYIGRDVPLKLREQLSIYLLKQY